MDKHSDAAARILAAYQQRFQIHAPARLVTERGTRGRLISPGPCDTCGSTLGGDREEYALTNAGLRADGTPHEVIAVDGDASGGDAWAVDITDAL
jgi:hypothetical protein